MGKIALNLREMQQRALSNPRIPDSSAIGLYYFFWLELDCIMREIIE
jgi:hypothetical protein